MSDLLLYAVIPVTFVLVNFSIQVNPRCYKCEVTSYYLKNLGLRWERLQENVQSRKQNKIKIMQMIKKLFENAHGHVIIVIVFIGKRITMKNIFQNSSSNGVRYDKYEWRTSADGQCYITLQPMPSHPSTILSRIMISWCWPQSISVLLPWTRQVNQN